MRRENVQSEPLSESKKSDEIHKRRPKKPHLIPDEDTKTLMMIAVRARNLRKGMNISYEEFALKSGVNRNTYFRFEKSAESGKNFTAALLLQIIRGLHMTPAEFFKDIR